MRNFLQAIAYLLSVHVLGLAFQAVIRLSFFLSVRPSLADETAVDPLLTAGAFLRGLWFDNVVACYVSAVPLLFFILAGVTGRWPKKALKIVNGWTGLLYIPIFMAGAANIPYFVYFNKLLNASIWNWAEYGTQTLGLMFGESSYYPYIALFFVTAIGFAACLRLLRTKLFARFNEERIDRFGLSSRLGVLLIGAVAGGLCFLGIRGRMGYNPIKVSAAYFCNHTTLNNLGVNPTFNLLNSTLDEMRPENRTLRLMDEKTAIFQVQGYLERKGLPGVSPLATVVRTEGEPTGRNVVLVLMESVSAKLMGRFGNERGLTPYLDSLYHRAVSFSNCYSAGNHTNHGIYATLYSFPSIMFRNAMKGSTIPTYSGLPTVLRENGYRTLFFMTHESQYDNMNAFLRTNGFDEIFAQENYPREARVNHFGVSDDFLFSYALPVLRRRAEEGRPFFATLLTISNHPPYVVPAELEDPDLTPEEEIVRYADRAIRDFMTAALKEPWAKNTIFVFVGDHGKAVGSAESELPESFNHVPLLILSPELSPHEINDFAGQVDIAPTLLGLLNISYTQNNFGIDLLRRRRPAAFYTADKTIAARNDSALYVFHAEAEKEFFYRLRDGRTVPVEADSAGIRLKHYVFPMLQAAEYLVQHGMTLDRLGK